MLLQNDNMSNTSKINQKSNIHCTISIILLQGLYTIEYTQQMQLILPLYTDRVANGHIMRGQQHDKAYRNATHVY